VKKLGFRIALSMLLSVCLMGLAAEPARAAMVEPRGSESGYAIVTAKTAEVREGPSSKAAVITVVERGEVFAKVGRTGGWYFLQISDSSRGWISGRALRRYVPETPPVEGDDQGDDEGVSAPPVEPRATYPPPSPWTNYGYPYWGQPYYYNEWYFYGSDPYWYGSWGHDYRSYDRYRGRDDDRYRDRDWESGRQKRSNDSPGSGGSHQDSHSETYQSGNHSSGSSPHVVSPRFPTPFRRR